MGETHKVTISKKRHEVPIFSARGMLGLLVRWRDTRGVVQESSHLSPGDLWEFQAGQTLLLEQRSF